MEGMFFIIFVIVFVVLVFDLINGFYDIVNVIVISVFIKVLKL